MTKTEISQENQQIFYETSKHLQLGQFEDAYNLTKNLFSLTPEDPTVLKLYGAACFLSKRTEEAEDCFSQAITLDKQVAFPILEFWAQLLAQFLNFSIPARLYAFIILNEPSHGDARITYAQYLASSEQFEEAFSELKYLKKHHSDLPRVWELDADLNILIGNKDAAILSAKKAIEINPASYNAFHILVDLTKADPNIIAPLNLEAFVAGAENKKNPAHIRAKLNHALGLLFEHQEDYEYAFKHYEIANTVSMEIHKEMGFLYNKDEIEQYTQSLKDVFGKALPTKKSKKKKERPIFILGLPFSGVNLVQGILSTHSKIKTKEDINTLSDFANRICSIAILDGIEDTKEKVKNEIETLKATYLGDLKTPYFIDKTLTSFFHLGLIKNMFPDAIFVHVKQDKMTTCFSNFIQPLSHYYVYATSLESINHFYKTYIGMMSFWKDDFDHVIYELDYQKLVQNPKKEIKALLNHCGLEFEEACLHSEKSVNSVLTLSSQALSEPINPNSTNRWKNFKPYLTELT
ncbi:MAG: tetratricopeptide repeat-containing sulfotransferase family protein [Sphingomonadales bacterium]